LKNLTSSSLSAFRDCARKYYYQYVLGRVKVAEAPALAFGHVTHGALEQWWLNGNNAMAAWLGANCADMQPQDAANLAAMLKHYDARNAHLRDKYTVLDVEMQFTIPIINPETGRPMRQYQLQGKVDGLLQDKATGARWVLEHKTTSDEIIGFGTYWQRLAVDHQVSFYVIATSAVGCLYDVLRKPKLKISKADEKAAAGGNAADAYMQRVSEAIAAEPEKYYQFREVVKTDDDIAEAKADLWHQAHMLAECEKQQRFPRNSGSCRSFYGTCQYLGVCTGQACIDDPSQFRSKSSTNEELTSAA